MKSNDGLTAKIILVAIAIFIIACMFVPGNSIYTAPIFNKILGILVAGISFFSFYRLAKDNYFFNTGSDKWDYFLQLGVGAVLAIAALLILAVWHSGPLGL